MKKIVTLFCCAALADVSFVSGKDNEEVVGDQPKTILSNTTWSSRKIVPWCSEDSKDKEYREAANVRFLDDFCQITYADPVFVRFFRERDFDEFENWSTHQELRKYKIIGDSIYIAEHESKFVGDSILFDMGFMAKNHRYVYLHMVE